MVIGLENKISLSTSDLPAMTKRPGPRGAGQGSDPEEGRTGLDSVLDCLNDDLGSDDLHGIVYHVAYVR